MKLHGINIPLFALRNLQGSGVGEYLDLIPMIHWVKKIGFNIIQLLPLNDSGDDASPYSALSANALHPLYLSLHHLPDLSYEMNMLLESLRRTNHEPRFNHTQVYEAKMQFLRLYYQNNGRTILESKQYQEFSKKQPWLDTYAHFKYLKTAHGLRPWWQWQENGIRDEYEIDFYKMVQYLSFEQFSQVRLEAEKHSIQLKGDIPILINRDSVDVWRTPSLFRLEFSAGAPPDMYAPEGQCWGFPIYNWQEHEKSHFQWWKERLHTAEKLYHLYRLDHIVGFFRIWSIPDGKGAREGYYIPEPESEWLPQGERILKMLLQSSLMKPIGEDLGNIPPVVREKMQELHIPGTKIMRWERRWHGDQSYIPIREYPYESMTSVSTHDSETLGGWWQEGREDVQLYCREKGWSYTPALSYDQRLFILEEAHRTSSKYHINLLQEYLNLFPDLSWNNNSEDRINIPGVVQPSNWTYRFKPSLEELFQHPSLSLLLSKLVNK